MSQLSNSSKPKIIFESENFTVFSHPDYVLTESRGAVGAAETELAAQATMDYMRQHDCHYLLFDVQDMPWINNLTDRAHRTGLAGEARDFLYRVAFVSKNSSVRYLTTILTMEGGIREVMGFPERESAREWLLRPEPIEPN